MENFVHPIDEFRGRAQDERSLPVPPTSSVVSRKQAAHIATDIMTIAGTIAADEIIDILINRNVANQAVTAEASRGWWWGWI